MMMRDHIRITAMCSLLISVVCVVHAIGYLPEDRGKTGESDQAQIIPVVCKPVKKLMFEDTVRLMGIVKACRDANVSARASGVVDAVFVKEGDYVRGGKSKLFRSGSRQLADVVACAEEDLTVADCFVREREAYLAAIMAEYATTEKDSMSISPHGRDDRSLLGNMTETTQTGTPTIAHAKTMLELARIQRHRAENRLARAQNELENSLVVAPINGVITECTLTAGETIKDSETVIRIEDQSVLEIICPVPDMYYGRIVAGRTVGRFWQCLANSTQYKINVIFVSSVINSRERTFKIRCLIDDPRPGIVSGASVNVELILDSHEAIAVPHDAVTQWKEGPVVFRVNGTRADKVPVKTGLVTSDYIEILEGALDLGDSIVTKGSFWLHDAAVVKIVDER